MADEEIVKEQVIATYTINYETEEGEFEATMTLALNELDNNGRTSFNPQDSVKLRLYFSDLILLNYRDSMVYGATSGTFKFLSEGTENITKETIEFTGDPNSSSQYAIESGFSGTWEGGDPATVTFKATTGKSEVIANITQSYIIGIATIAYTTRYFLCEFRGANPNALADMVWVRIPPEAFV